MPCDAASCLLTWVQNKENKIKGIKNFKNILNNTQLNTTRITFQDLSFIFKNILLELL